MRTVHPRPYPTTPTPGMTYLENVVRDAPAPRRETDLHVWPTDMLPKRWNWTLGYFGRGSTLGYPTPEVALDNARWQEVVFVKVFVHERTRSDELALSRARIDEINEASL